MKEADYKRAHELTCLIERERGILGMVEDLQKKGGTRMAALRTDTWLIPLDGNAGMEVALERAQLARRRIKDAKAEMEAL